MTKQFFGYYLSEEKAINTVNILGLRGYKSKHITIFTNDHSANKLKKRTHVYVKSIVPQSINKTKPSVFSNKKTSIINKNRNKTVNPYDQLKEFGLYDKQITEVLEKISSGKILVIADDQKGTGHHPLGN